MNEQSQKVLSDLLSRAVQGVDKAVEFSQAQIPDVIHQLLVWNFVSSLITTILTLLTIPLVSWFLIKQSKKKEIGVFGNGEGYSWNYGKPKYKTTFFWKRDGDFNEFVIVLVAVVATYSVIVFNTIANMTWLKIWLAPKLYLLEYAASLVK